MNLYSCCGRLCDAVQEPPTDTALLQHPQVTCTPHLGASTVDAQTRVALDIAKQFIAFSRQTALTGAVCTAQHCSEANWSFLNWKFDYIRILMTLLCGRVKPHCVSCSYICLSVCPSVLYRLQTRKRKGL